MTEPRLPRYTRIQTLQMLSTLLPTGLAADCLTEAGSILGEMDQSQIQVQLLTQDNRSMEADVQIWKKKGDDEQMAYKEKSKGEQMANEAPASGDDRPSEAYWAYDREVQAKLRQELAEELEHSGFNEHQADAAETDSERINRERRERDDAAKFALSRLLSPPDLHTAME